MKKVSFCIEHWWIQVPRTFSRVGADCRGVGAPPVINAMNLGRNITQWLENHTILQYFRLRVSGCNILLLMKLLFSILCLNFLRPNELLNFDLNTSLSLF